MKNWRKAVAAFVAVSAVTGVGSGFWWILTDASWFVRIWFALAVIGLCVLASEYL